MKNEGDYTLYSNISDEEMVRLSDYLLKERFEINVGCSGILDTELPGNLNWVGYYSDSDVLLAKKNSRLEEALNKFPSGVKKRQPKIQPTI